ncbi:extradiol ring-cleavage dioxygenase [Trinickia terrae]|uniref:Extradiol ring-cleavage dioxygenase n=1 Tax=Trinickia terrae TaxID=2571161 RepID=A0A4U1I987_9BURK|nr:extradiol ring-cleavage dioxygenase [Trinickia terrae]TKC90046.1 extradiol ring-cleavage dioxygenase [Trinickia terrae]
MAEIVMGIGLSHTPLLTLESQNWLHRASADYENPKLNTSDGRWISYAQLLSEVGPRYASVVTVEELVRKGRICESALDKLADSLANCSPDVVVIVGDDQAELFGPENQPAIALYHGARMTMLDKFGDEGSPEWVREMGRGYLMDRRHSIPASPELAGWMIGSMVDDGIDVAAVGELKDPAAGFGHAYGFVVKRLFRGREIPVVPVLLNTYFPPNVPTAARCLKIGAAIGAAVKSFPSDIRVAIIASGGLSHFVVDEELDLRVLQALKDKDCDALRALPRGALNSGSSEILNWLTVAGAVETLTPHWTEYQPLYRTPAGTGVGAAFMEWR